MKDNNYSKDPSERSVLYLKMKCYCKLERRFFRVVIAFSVRKMYGLLLYLNLHPDVPFFRLAINAFCHSEVKVSSTD